MKITDEMIEAAALSDAEFDGRNFVCMGRVDRDRYMLRAKASLTAALSAIEPAGVGVETVPEGWTVTHPTYHKYPHVVEWICGEWHLRKHHGNGASHTVSTHATHTDAIAALTKEATHD